MRIRAVLLVGASLIGAAGCGTGEPATPISGLSATTQPAAADDGPDLSAVEFEDLSSNAKVAVTAADNRFIKPYIEVKTGTTVTFTNRGRNEHDVVPVDSGAFKDIKTASFEPQGGTGAVTFVKPGDYAYYCSLHGTKTKGMVGAIRVLA